MILDNASLLLLAAPAAMLLVSLAAIQRTGLSQAVVQRLGIGAAAFAVYVTAIAAPRSRPIQRPSGILAVPDPKVENRALAVEPGIRSIAA